MLFEEKSYTCPYCGEELVMEVNSQDGESQDFVSDCDVCCKPIVYSILFSDDEIEHFHASRDDD